MNSQISLKEACDFILDGTHGSPERVQEGVPVLSAQNVVNGRLNFSTDRFTTVDEYLAFHRRLKIEKGDVLLTIVGTIGRAAVVDEVKPLVFQRSVAVFRPRQTLLDSRFLFHITQSVDFQDQTRKSTNQSSQAGIYLGKLEKIKIPLLPISEQKRIAAILDKAEELRGLRRKALGELDAIVQSIFLEMFGDPTKNPKHSIASIRPFVKAGSGKSSKRVLSSTPTDIPIYGGNGINGYAIQPLYSEPVLVVGRVGQQCGKTYVTDKPVWVTDNAIAVEITSKERLNLTYLLHVFSMTHMSETVKHLDLPFINQQMILDFPLPIPPISLQQEFARRVEAIEQLKATHRESLAHLNALFASLQHRALRGEL